MKTMARQSDAADLVRRVQQLTPASVRRWGRMSAAQMVCHLSDSCLMATGEARVRPFGSAVQRTFVKWMALYLPIPWPRGLVTSAEIDQEGGGTKPGDFARDRARLQVLLERLAGPAASLGAQPHPVFGRLSRSEWLRWAYLHTDHHLRQFGA